MDLFGEGQTKRASERQTHWMQEKMIRHQRISNHGRQSSWSVDNRPHNSHGALHGHQGSIPECGKWMTCQLDEGQANGWRAVCWKELWT
jgi:hypothetical protein